MCPIQYTLTPKDIYRYAVSAAILNVGSVIGIDHCKFR